MKLADLFYSVNVEVNGFRIENIAEKVGYMAFGEVGRVIGKVIDNSTKEITLEINTRVDE